jgi:hypothetical protein
MASTNQVNTVTTENVVPVGATYDANGNFITLIGAAGAPINALSGGGTANGVAYLNGSKVLTTGSALTFDGTNFATTGSATGTAFIPSGSTVPTNGMYLPTTNTVAWSTNNTERMRLDPSGNLLVGTTSTLNSGKLSVNAGGTNGITCQVNDVVNPCFQAWSAVTSGNSIFVNFATEGTFTSRGTIGYNRAGGLVAYNTTSDYRAKDIIGPVQDSGATIDALKVYEGQMKGATQSRPMLVAHEAQAVTPYAVTGEKDAVKEDGTADYQQMDVSSLVPLLIAEIQSIRIRIAQLEAK